MSSPTDPSGEDLPESPGDFSPTGQAGVDAALEALSGLDELPLAEHVNAYQRVHEDLRTALDEEPTPGDPA
ncbi:hypothetical protein GCM10027591_12170 [Zhihengliuella somnathii]